MEEKHLTYKQANLLHKKINKILKKNNFDLKLEKIVEFNYDLQYLFENLSNDTLTPRDDLLLSIIEDYYYYKD